MTLKDPNNPITTFECVGNIMDFLHKMDNDSSKTETEITTKDENNDKDTLKYIGGVDISKGTIDEDMACAGLVILEYPSLKQVCHKFKMVRYNKPYIPGFLAFREVDFLIDIINELKNDEDNKKYVPQVILVDGNGILHHRGFGLASHLGVLSKIPTIGIGKELYMMDGLDRKLIKEQCDRYLTQKGDYLELIGDTKDVIHGAAVRCGEKGKCIFA